MSRFDRILYTFLALLLPVACAVQCRVVPRGQSLETEGPESIAAETCFTDGE